MRLTCAEDSRSALFSRDRNTPPTGHRQARQGQLPRLDIGGAQVVRKVASRQGRTARSKRPSGPSCRTRRSYLARVARKSDPRFFFKIPQPGVIQVSTGNGLMTLCCWRPSERPCWTVHIGQSTPDSPHRTEPTPDSHVGGPRWTAHVGQATFDTRAEHGGRLQALRDGQTSFSMRCRVRAATRWAARASLFTRHGDAGARLVPIRHQAVWSPGEFASRRNASAHARVAGVERTAEPGRLTAIDDENASCVANRLGPKSPTSSIPPSRAAVRPARVPVLDIHPTQGAGLARCGRTCGRTYATPSTAYDSSRLRPGDGSTAMTAKNADDPVQVHGVVRDISSSSWMPSSPVTRRLFLAVTR